jgi:hypothetical protein
VLFQYIDLGVRPFREPCSVIVWSLMPSGHYMYHQFNIHTHSVFMCFVWISEQTGIISLYNIIWLVCITETECVYCAVRTGCLYIIQVPFCSRLHSMSLRAVLFNRVSVSLRVKNKLTKANNWSVHIYIYIYTYTHATVCNADNRR